MQRKKRLFDVLKTVTNKHAEIIVIFDDGTETSIDLNAAREYFGDCKICRAETIGNDMIIDFNQEAQK